MFRPEKILANLRRQGIPRRTFKRHLLTRLEAMQVGESVIARPWFPGWHRAAVLSLCLVLFLSMGTGVYAYESPSVTEGHVLFGLKSKLESAEGSFAMSAEARAAFHAKMLHRRLLEAERLGDKVEGIDPLLDVAASEFSGALTELEDPTVTAEERETIKERIQANGEKYLEIQSRIRINENPEAAPLPPAEFRARLEELHERVRLSTGSADEKRLMFRQGLREIDFSSAAR